MSIPKKSRTKGELIPAVIIEYRNWPNLYLTKEQYNEWGGYRAMLKDFEVPVGEVKKVHHLLLNPRDFPTAEWNP